MSGIINSAGSRSGVIGTTELDYEEGVWTAEFQDQSGNASASTAVGVYTKIGRQVTVHAGREDIDSTGPYAHHALRLYGLPFACGNYGYKGQAGTVSWAQMGPTSDTAASYDLVPIIRANSSFVEFFKGGTAANVASVIWSDITDDQMDYTLAITYFTA